MTPRKSSYVKVIGLFLLIIAVEVALVVIVNRFLRTNGMASDTSIAILRSVFILVVYVTWRWLCLRLNAIEKR